MDTIAQLTSLITGKILEQPNKPLSPTEPLISTGLIDSFHLVDLALLVEDEFGVHIDDSELNQDTFNTIADLAGLIDARRA